ncbi:Gfo/Idh/MocA family oxidoreductase [Shinella sp. CPCC 100929]|uniref:Gfo/Idh/MocA family oxidoreductase n=1 Tax=Shinella lacus TaxID=2654216 RepID=A0ABT1REG5_9HYPH|nr:Gfo/Idh/MocA family oxidoreductase [Shinella lacus]MCQ4633588.1 Gfo/Idh/MocA family oxidoreductase [Shinella lacus]
MGTGTIATEHMVAAIRSVGHQPLWVVSRNRQYATHFSQDMQIAGIAVDARPTLRDPRVQYAYVSAARDRRKHYILAAAAARKHVLCDGPIAGNSRIAANLAEECRKAGILLALNQPFRTLSPHQTMRRLLQDGEIGTLQSLLIARGAPFQLPPNRHIDEAVDRGGALLEMSVDSIDLARFLTGQEPAAVTALSSVPASPDGDQISYAIRLSSGALFQSYESFTTAEFESIVMLAGDRGTLTAHGTLSGRGSGALVRRLNGRNELIPVRERDQHMTTIEAFLALPQSSGTWMSLAEDNVIALRTAEAVQAAARRRHISVSSP